MERYERVFFEHIGYLLETMATTRQSPDGAKVRRASHLRDSAPAITSDEPLSHEEVAHLAYELWQARGCPEGSSEIDWLHAEQELRSRIIEKNSEPAPPPLSRKSAAGPRVLRAPRATGQKRASVS